MRHHFIWVIGISLGIFCGCAATPRSATSQPVDFQKISLRNNAASLLLDLTGDEKNVSKILIIKRNSAELGSLIRAISVASNQANKELKQLAKVDSTLNLSSLKLPTGEIATRAAIAKTKEHELLSSSGEDFQFDLLMTQADALSYGWHLAGIAAENSSSPAAMQIFNKIRTDYKSLYVQVIEMLKE